MKNLPIITALLLSIASATTIAADKKEFGRKQLSVGTNVAIMEMLTEVTSRVDAKFMKGDPDFHIYTNRKALKRICLGTGPEFPDMVATTREMNEEEFKRCQKNVPGSLIKLKIGYEALVVATSKKSIDLNLDERKLYMALANDVPKPGAKTPGVLTANPYNTWNDIDPDAPKKAIKFYAPAAVSHDERSVKLLGMEGGCRTWEWVPDMKYVQRSYRLYRALCNEPRKDGKYIRADVAGADLTDKILSDKNSIGLINFNDWQKSKGKLKAFAINELPPTIATISKGLYPLSRSYYVYIKLSSLKKVSAVSHVMNELVNDKTLGSDGYLSKMGLIPMPAKELKREVTQALEFNSMTPPEPS